MADWTDPRPQLPHAEFRVLVKCSDNTVRYASYNKYEGWKTAHGYFWSMAHPKIVGWKRAAWPPQTNEERAAAHREWPEWCRMVYGEPQADVAALSTAPAQPTGKTTDADGVQEGQK